MNALTSHPSPWRGAALAVALALGLSGAGPVAAGPSEVTGIEERLATVEASIDATEARMRDALIGQGGDPGEFGIQLRALKLERARLTKDLETAVAAQKEREKRAGIVPTNRPGEARKPIEQGPTATPLPAPAL
jgi:hypothetical protein